MISDKPRSCSRKYQETPRFIFRVGIKGNLLEFKEFEMSENGEESVYEQERELREMQRDETCNKYFFCL